MADQIAQTSIGEKEQQEIEKLKLENAQLRQPWRSPAFLIAVGGLVLSLLGNMQQGISAAAARAEAAEKLSLERDKWEKEREKLSVEIASAKVTMETSAADRADIEKELQQINQDIEAYDEAIEKARIELLSAQNQLELYKAQKRQAKAEAQVHIVSNHEMALQTFTNDREALITRRSELEKRLGK